MPGEGLTPPSFCRSLLGLCGGNGDGLSACGSDWNL